MVELNEGQKKALTEMVKWAFAPDKDFVFSGLAGTGKTFVLSEFYHRLREPTDIVFVAPTGRAAANLAMRGVPARTIHSLIYDLDDTTKKLAFVKKDKIAPTIRRIVVDESSMVNKSMYDDLRSYGIPICFCGDSGQLPPIGESPGIMDNPDVFLSEPVRQVEDSQIVKIAHSINKGGTISCGTYGSGEVVILNKSLVNLALMEKADQVIVATNKERQRINEMFRKARGFVDKIPEKGDKLVCTRNLLSVEVDDVPLINGMIGYCEGIKMHTINTAYMMFRPEFSDKSVVVEIDVLPFIGRPPQERQNLALFDFGYAITLHKAQGSEWDKVLVIRDFNIKSIDERKWLYTAVTRAKKKLVLAV